MIFVTVGSTNIPFDRLVSGVANLDIDEEIVLQRGGSRMTAANADVVDFLSFEELDDYVRQSTLVISHAGVGSILMALTHGHHPIVVPRLARFGEAVDDHQAQVAARLGERGRVTVVQDLRDLQRIVTSATRISSDHGMSFGPLADIVAAEVERALNDC